MKVTQSLLRQMRIKLRTVTSFCFSDMLFTKPPSSYAIVLLAYFKYSVQKAEINSSSDVCMCVQAGMTCISLDCTSMLLYIENCHLLTGQVRNCDFYCDGGQGLCSQPVYSETCACFSILHPRSLKWRMETSTPVWQGFSPYSKNANISTIYDDSLIKWI